MSGFWQGSDVILTVADTGPGIPPEILPHIFDFSPASMAAGQRQSQRLGFGLWWVKTLITRFGGLITVESDGYSGTTFILELPLAEGGS